MTESKSSTAAPLSIPAVPTPRHKDNNIKQVIQLFINDPQTPKEIETLLIRNDWTTKNGIDFVSPGAVLGTDGRIDLVNKCFVCRKEVYPFKKDVNFSYYQMLLKLRFNGNYTNLNSYLAERYANKTALPFDLLKLVNESEIDLLSPLVEAPVILRIDGLPILTYSNFLVLIGKAKSRKTFFSMVLIAAMVTNRTVYNVSSSLLQSSRTVLFIDTEQSNFHVQLFCKRVAKLANLSEIELKANFRAFALRQHPTAQRFEAVRYLVENTDNLGCVVVDGLRDLITDINSQEQAVAIIDFLMSWTMQKNIGLITILHQNKNDLNARGAVGTEGINKAEATISITKDTKNKEVSIVSSEYSRNKEFEDFAFLINSDGIPEVCEMPASDSKKKIVEPIEIFDERHIEILQRVFKGIPSLGYSELWRKIKYEFSLIGIKFGDNKAKDYLSHYESKGFLNVVNAGAGGRKNFSLKDQFLAQFIGLV